MQTMTVAQLADFMQTTEEAVLNKIHGGEIVASNINTKPNAQRPRWRILETDFAAFLVRTRFQSAVQTEKPKRARAKRTSAKDYFPA